MQRRYLLGSAFAASACAVSGLAVPRARAAPTLPDDPTLQNDALVRILGRTDSGEAIWSAQSRIYAVTDNAVIPLLHTRGSARSWWRPLGEPGEHRYQRHLSSLSFYHDPHSGALIDGYDNPLTGAYVPLTVSAMRRKDAEIFTPTGSYHPGSRARFPEMYDEKPLALDWRIDNGVLRVNRHEVFAPVARQPMGEAHTYFAPAEQALDPDIASASAQSAGWFVSSYSGFLGMGDLPGRMLWQFEAVKLDSLEQLDAAYLERARSLVPHFDRSPEFDNGPSYLERIEQGRKQAQEGG